LKRKLWCALLWCAASAMFRQRSSVEY
jgi:hypothetical protein